MKRDFAALTSQHFDLLVCGGGIYGAWTAYDATLRGLKVALIEQDDWASATSSASSKLIHGGLRYLETFDFKLVNKALTERGMLLQTGPHRVWPLRFGVPIYADSRMYRLQLKAGLTLYDFMAHSPDANMRHRYFNRKQFAAHFSALKTEGLRGGFTYADAQTDDARLVLELVSGAMAAGAVCVNYAKLTQLCEVEGVAVGAAVQDQVTRSTCDIQAKKIVHATGQWLGKTGETQQWCRLSKGVHLVLPASVGDEALLLTAKADGRVFFMIPWYGRTVLGTTDTDYQGDIEQVKVEQADIDYLLQAANVFLKMSWTQADVIGSYAGLRVMRHSDDASPSSVSRDWELKKMANGVLCSVGGKLTSAREDAKLIVDEVCVQLGGNQRVATQGRALPWAVEDFDQWAETMTLQAQVLGVDVESTKWLIRRHGKRTPEIFQSIEAAPELAERIVPDVPLIYADLRYCAITEVAVYWNDLLRRRMPLSILAKLSEAELDQIKQRLGLVLLH